jgi:hypothetical protein
MKVRRWAEQRDMMMDLILVVVLVDSMEDLSVD